MLSGIALQHVETENGKLTMNPGIIDMQEEVYKLIQQAALYDFLKDNSIKELLGNTDKYVARIRFNDKDNLSASLTGEKGVKCIYDTKTFMCIRNSLDLVENIVSIVVTFVKGKEKLVAKYDAADNRFLTVHILSNKYYSDSDFQEVWELYKSMNQGILEKLAQFVNKTTLRQIENLTLSMLTKKLNVSEDEISVLMYMLQEERIVTKNIRLYVLNVTE